MNNDESIRDYIAFPKNNSGKDVMIDSPSSIDKSQLDELNIKLKQFDIQIHSIYNFLFRSHLTFLRTIYK